MEAAAPARADGTAPFTRLTSPRWSGQSATLLAPSKPSFALMPWFAGLLVLGLIGWHAWTTLQLFGTENPWQRLIDNQPIISGRHPLHLYHGCLGARAFLATRRLSCYDPAFQAG